MTQPSQVITAPYHDLIGVSTSGCWRNWGKSGARVCYIPMRTFSRAAREQDTTRQTRHREKALHCIAIALQIASVCTNQSKMPTGRCNSRSSTVVIPSFFKASFALGPTYLCYGRSKGLA